jgi:hypothetical protein
MRYDYSGLISPRTRFGRTRLPPSRDRPDDSRLSRSFALPATDNRKLLSAPFSQSPSPEGRVGFPTNSAPHSVSPLRGEEF